MTKLHKLIKRFVEASIDDYNKGSRMPEEFPEIEKELRVAAAKLDDYLEALKTIALKEIERQIENGNPDRPEKWLADWAKELRQ